VTETAPRRRSPGRIAAALAVVVALVALDLWSKAWVTENLSRPRHRPVPVCEPAEDGNTYEQRARALPIVVIEDFAELRYAENCGAAFSLFNGAPSALRKGLFYGVAVIACLLLTVLFVQGRGSPWFAAAVPLVIAGAVGNFVDRFHQGYVVDFIRFYWKQYEYPTFNVADIAISFGVICLVADAIADARASKPC
jgi:signal peptidase II